MRSRTFTEVNLWACSWGRLQAELIEVGRPIPKIGSTVLWAEPIECQLGTSIPTHPFLAEDKM